MGKKSRQQLVKDELWQTAVTALRRCYEFEKIPGIKASGQGHFNNGVWLRDAVLGGWGSLVIGAEVDLKAVRCFLEFFLKSSPDVPYRVLEKHQAGVYLGLKIKSGKRETRVPLLKALYNPALLRAYLKGRGEITDRFLILSLAGNYLSSNKVSQGEKNSFWKNQKSNLYKFWKDYLNNFCSNQDLIDQECPLSSRQDSVLKSGAVLLTNVLWFKTNQDLSKGVKKFDPSWSKRLTKLSGKIKEQINQQFWLGQKAKNYYLDWKDNDKSWEGFDSMANFWAIILEIADKNKTKKILKFVADNKKKLIAAKAGLVGTFWPKYPGRLIDFGSRLAGFSGYYNSIEGKIFWPETTILYAGALKKAGKTKLANKTMKAVEKLLGKYQTLHEVYDNKGRPMKKWYYQAPADFAMALGTYLLILNLAPDRLTVSPLLERS